MRANFDEFRKVAKNSEISKDAKLDECSANFRSRYYFDTLEITALSAQKFARILERHFEISEGQSRIFEEEFDFSRERYLIFGKRFS